MDLVTIRDAAELGPYTAKRIRKLIERGVLVRIRGARRRITRSCVARNQRGVLVFRFYWQGRWWTESSGEKWTTDTEKKGRALAVVLAESMRRGHLAADYHRFFPDSSRFRPRKKASGRQRRR